MLGKSVVMSHGLERTGNHNVLKVPRTIESGNSNSEPLAHAKVSGLPGNFAVQANKPFRNTGDGTFSSSSRGVLVRVDATSEIEHSLSWSANHGG